MEFQNVRTIEIQRPDWEHWWNDGTLVFPRERYDPSPKRSKGKPIKVKFSNLSLRLGIQQEF